MFKKIIYLVLTAHLCESFLFNDDNPHACNLTNGGTPFIFEVLPGLGWDNLINENRGVVLNYNYSYCKTTEDRRYLIPNDVVVIPIKKSQMNIFSQIYDHWSQYESDTAFSINANGYGWTLAGKISGSMSTEFQHVKSHQIEDKAMTTKVQARFRRYTAKVIPDSQLNPEFRKRVLRIANHIQHNRSLSTQYESQLLIRDYGSHVITSVEAGASIVKVDHIKSSITSDSTMDKTTISVASSFSFPGLFSVSLSSRFSNTQSSVDKYNQYITDSDIRTYGGPILSPDNFNITNWSNMIGNDLVTIDRDGMPIYTVISPQTFPELSDFLVNNVVQNVQMAISTYLKHNTYRGCTNPADPNFSKVANLDDGSCTSPLTNLSFGGVYQICRLSGQSLPNNENPCEGLYTLNPQTGTDRCPDGFDAIPLYSSQKVITRSAPSCHRCWLFFKCCHDVPVSATAHFQAYWCQAESGAQLPSDSGYLFGGLFSSTIDNINTGSKSCPQHYNSFHILYNTQICVSDDFELASPYAVPFGGFHSCQSINPLASGPGSSKYCPKGFSNHLVTIDDSCEVNYCIQTGKLGGLKLPSAQFPPYIDVPAESMEEAAHYMISDDKTSWTRIVNPKTGKIHPDEKKWTSMQSSSTEKSNLKQTFSQNYDDIMHGSGLSKGAVAGVSVAATTTFFCLLVGILVGIRRHRRIRLEHSRLQ
ncbi:macrophage-expressed gene 1 protein-like [Saccostrea cucullata]|uniref:macrophage-expressed gene 1 protein-like n=1 Tax=Saccostrea cuccullata TaxID=36930 RepID=UPI002ED465A7